MKERKATKSYDLEKIIEAMRSLFERSGNPHYAWYAINLCSKDNTPFPNWLGAYLDQCSERMVSDKARQTSDLRTVLPWALGFPKKRGSGKLLNPYRDEKRLDFIIQFGTLILQGYDPATARRDACNNVFDGKAADVDDRTLMRWVLEDLDLKKAPGSAEQWENAVGNYFASVIPLRLGWISI
jgi:hypothetical protein